MPNQEPTMNKATAQLVTLIETGYPRFGLLPPRHQEAIAKMVFDWHNPTNRHKKYDGCAVMGKAYLRSIWGNDATARKVLQGEYFIVYYGDNREGYVRGYMPQDHVLEAFKKFRQEAQGNESMRLLRIPTKMPAAPIKSRVDVKSCEKTSERKSKWAGLALSPTMPVNQTALADYSRHCTDTGYLAEAERLQSFSRNELCPGHIPVLYQQKLSGRIYEVNYALQSMPRSVRQAALSGNWDYDVSNCHFDIFSQWARQLGWQTPMIDSYLADKKRIRQTLANNVQASVDKIKRALLALLYGAQLRCTRKSCAQHEHGVPSIQEILGDVECTLFIQQPFVRALREEIQRVGKVLIKNMPRVRGLVVNHFGGLMDQTTSSVPKLLCHGLQGFEAAALHAVVSKYGEHVILCMHDGWISRRRLPVDDLRRVIRDATGLGLNVEEEQIEYTGVPIVRPSLLSAEGLEIDDDWQICEVKIEPKIQSDHSQKVEINELNQGLTNSSVPVQPIPCVVAPVLQAGSGASPVYGEPAVPSGLSDLAVFNRPKWAQCVPTRIR